MSKIFSRYFGNFDLQNREVVHFRSGLPGFEDQTHFAAISIPGQEPILYLQSLTSPDVCLITLPARVFVPGYQLDLSPEDRETLGIPDDLEPRIGSTVACQVIVTVDQSRQPTVNLAAPVIINLSNHLASQIYQGGANYSFRHPVMDLPQAVQC